MKKISFFLCIVFLLAACASKRFTKQGAKFEEAGLYEDAAKHYYEAVKRKDSNVDAKLGLRKTGQMTLDQKLNDFMNSYKQASFDKAVYEFIDAEDYNKKLKKVGVNLSFPENYRTYYEESKSDYLGQKYSEGLEKLNREDFAGALSIFAEIKSIDENYKDVQEKFIAAKYEPRYRTANQYLETGFYRKAYYEYESILSGAGDYKQSASLKEEAREKGTITILVTELTASSRSFYDAAVKISSRIQGEIGHLSNPFIQIKDPSSLNGTINKQGQIDMQVANLAGIDVILTGVLNDFRKKTGDLIETPKRGYLKEVVIVKNSAGEETEKVTYHKTNYSEFHAKNSAWVSLSYKMISTKNNEVLISDSYDRQNSDEIRYAVFEGDAKKLVPGYWKYKKGNSEEDVINDNKNDVRALKRLLDANRKIEPADRLLENLVTDAIGEITTKVDKYNPEI
jgi:hypothetical protein